MIDINQNISIQDIVSVGGVVVAIVYTHFISKQNKEDLKSLKSSCNCGVLSNEIKHLKEDILELRGRK